MSKLNKLIVSLFLLLFLSPSIWSIIRPYENWPFTSIPLFAHYVDSETPRFRFIFEAELEDSTRKELRYHSIAATWPLMRHFFKQVYGSTDKYPLFNLYPNDTPEKFEKRLGNFFQIFESNYLKKHDQKLKSIDLKVAKLTWDNKVAEEHLVGTYYSETKLFEHTWGRGDK